MIASMSEDILVIDDNPTNLELMSYLLNALGHGVRTAGGGAEGLAMARELSPDLIICDVLMPEMDGYEVARLLGVDPILGTVPLLGVTALAMVDDRRKVLASGFDGYISKPINPETFVSEVSAFLRERRAGPSTQPA
jgi:CheY-like chemotaxis protein